MLKKPHDFVNREGEKIELLCEMDHANGHMVYRKVILPEGTKIKPQFLWGNEYIFITYKEDKWYLLN